MLHKKENSPKHSAPLMSPLLTTLAKLLQLLNSPPNFLESKFVFLIQTIHRSITFGDLNLAPTSFVSRTESQTLEREEFT